MEQVLRKLRPNYYTQGLSNFVYRWPRNIYNKISESQFYVDSSQSWQAIFPVCHHITIQQFYDTKRGGWIITLLKLNIHLMTKLHYLLSTLYGRAGDLYLFLFIMYSATTSTDSMILSFISANKCNIISYTQQACQCQLYKPCMLHVHVFQEPLIHLCFEPFIGIKIMKMISVLVGNLSIVKWTLDQLIINH